MRQGAEIPFSCRNGICQVCRNAGTREVPAEAQKGCGRISSLGLFPALPLPAARKSRICTAECRRPVCAGCGAQQGTAGAKHLPLLLEPSTTLRYRAGQFINLRRADGLVAAIHCQLPDEDYFLELHVKRMRMAP